MGFIGVIDSGVGGLTVLNQLRKNYRYNYCYIADHAFCPYGTKSNDVIYARTSKLVEYLKSSGAQAVVLACNTMSAYADKLRSLFDIPVFNVITPTCRKLIDNPNVKLVALLATKSTLNNGVYQKILNAHNIEVVGFDCSDFVPFVEQRSSTTLACFDVLDNKLKNLSQMKADAVILGCTHFPLLRRQIALYCSDKIIVECCCGLPENLTNVTAQCAIDYYTTGNVDFAENASRWYGNARFKHLDL